MVNEFAKVLEHMDNILNNQYVFKIINGMELLLRFIELEKDKAKLEKEVIHNNIIIIIFSIF